MAFTPTTKTKWLANCQEPFHYKWFDIFSFKV